MTFDRLQVPAPESHHAARVLCDDLTTLRARGAVPFVGSDPWTSTPPSRAVVPRLDLVARMFWCRGRT